MIFITFNLKYINNYCQIAQPKTNTYIFQKYINLYKNRKFNNNIHKYQISKLLLLSFNRKLSFNELSDSLYKSNESWLIGDKIS